MNLKEKAYINRSAILCHAGIDLFLLAAYVSEWAKGTRTFQYLMIIAAFAILPVAAEILVYLKDRESKYIHHIMGVCYSSMYIFIIFTSRSLLPFTYAIPMYIVITLFSDIPYCISICVGGFLANVGHVAYYSRTVGYTEAETPDMQIRLVIMALVGLYMVLTSIFMKRVNDAKLKRIEEEQKKTADMLEGVLAASGIMIDGIGQVTGKMGLLGESVDNIRDSMREVSSGSNETAQSIQHQMHRTGQIQDYIAGVKETAGEIRTNMAEAAREVENGSRHMELLSGSVEKSLEANGLVLDRMGALSACAERMNSIIETITGIAGRTGMLALNASIEAARAGAAGKGFAVVADEISALSGQTKTATVEIAELIGSIHRELSAVNEAVEVVAEGSRANGESSAAVTLSFDRISRETGNVERLALELSRVLEELGSANADIVENIRTISAITEEVSAHSSETFEACGGNSRVVEEVSRIVRELNAEAEKLQQRKEA